MLTETDPLGNTTSYEYDAKNRPTLIDYQGRQTAFDYDSYGRPTQITDAVGNAFASSYEQSGYETIATLTSPFGFTTRTTYSWRGNVIEERDANGAIRQYRYNANHDLIREVRKRTLADGSVEDLVWQHSFDAKGNRLTQTDPLGRTTRQEYNHFNKETASFDANGDVIQRTEYDARGNAIRITDALGRETIKSYDHGDRLLTETDHQGRMTRFRYDGAGRLLETTYPDGTATSMTL